jgi:hypothetical protein
MAVKSYETLLAALGGMDNINLANSNGAASA